MRKVSESQLESIFREVKEDNYKRLVSRGRENTKKFVWSLRAFKYLNGKDRGNFLEAYYALMRHLDDVVDGDLPVPQGDFKTAESYVKNSIEFLRNQVNPITTADYLMLYCTYLANKFEEDFSLETQDILGSLLFDAKRVGRSIVFPKKDLEEHFHTLDINGTTKGMLKLYKEDPEKSEALTPIGNATRIYYTLRDFGEDVRSGFINVPLEDCERYEISLDEIKSGEGIAIGRWKRDQAKRGLILLSEHKENLPQLSLGTMTELTLWLMYERLARNFFERKIKIIY